MLGLKLLEPDHNKHPLWGGQWYLAPTIGDRYLGKLAGGWWKLGKSSITDHFKLELTLGGEDNMAQAGLVLPFLGRVHAGVRVPRQLTKGWIYEEREWSLRLGYVGRWAELLIGSDENMRDTGMVEYYHHSLKNPNCGNCSHCQEFHINSEGRCITGSEIHYGCEPCGCPGYVPAKLSWSRLALHPGWHFTLNPHLTDRLLGRMECTTVKGESIPVLVPMPEGNYPGIATRETRMWKRKRWSFSEKRRTTYWIDMQIAPPVPGKGENSWDCEDDGIYGTGGDTIPEAIANVTRAALRGRERYGSGASWVPDAGWPEGIARLGGRTYTVEQISDAVRANTDSEIEDLDEYEREREQHQGEPDVSDGIGLEDKPA